MCRTCGCSAGPLDRPLDRPLHPPAIPELRKLAIETALLAKNDRLAGELRRRFAERAVIAVNLIGAPGAGKTTLLEHTIRELAPRIPLAVIEGDQATDHDARRIAATGCAVVQINTDAGCHLDAAMLEGGLAQLTPEARSLLFIENVGNLVCPALFDLGEDCKVVVMSVTEGEDKPLKYPHVFRAASVLVLTKVDLVPHLEVDVDACLANARRVNPALEVFQVAARRGGVGREGFTAWCQWLTTRLAGAS
jgi:hydrogenase nickel incorporation protein HypB